MRRESTASNKLLLILLNIIVSQRSTFDRKRFGGNEDHHSKDLVETNRLVTQFTPLSAFLVEKLPFKGFQPHFLKAQVATSPFPLTDLMFCR